MLEVMRRMLLWMLEAVEGGLCLREVLEVLEWMRRVRLCMLEAPEEMRCMLLCMLEAVEGGGRWRRRGMELWSSGGAL